jgi:hypothetical protein
MVAGITLMFAFTFVGLVWLARDVDRGISNRSAASSIAFQAARSGAQAAFAPALRDGVEPIVNGAAGKVAATETANLLFASYGVVGTIDVVVTVANVSTTVTITDTERTVTGVATVESKRAP